MKNLALNIFTEDQITDFLSDIFIFENVTTEDVRKISSSLKFEISEFLPNEKIYSPDGFFKKVGFVLSGECSVEKQKPDGTSVPLNKLYKGDSFGILAVFSDSKKFPTVVKSSKSTQILFLDKETLTSLIEKYPKVALSIISFMSNRIDFLNKKIATFSADSVEEKFAVYLVNEAKQSGNMSFSLNLSKIARTLNAGRASVYRAIDALEKLSLIKFENKKIYISDLKGLERITK